MFYFSITCSAHIWSNDWTANTFNCILLFHGIFLTWLWSIVAIKFESCSITYNAPLPVCNQKYGAILFRSNQRNDKNTQRVKFGFIYLIFEINAIYKFAFPIKEILAAFENVIGRE